MTTLDEPKVQDGPTPPPHRGGPGRALLAFGRNTWRGLTSMRIALVLLFLLALGALPGALLPQRSLNEPKVEQYIASHGWWGQLLDRLQFYTVYSSVWFSAIYVLLFVSLVGCLLPRTVDYARQWFAKPVLTPRNLARLPHHTELELDATAGTPDQVLDRVRGQLGGWRMVRRIDDTGAPSISAERGFVRETGNLLFHFAMLGLIVAFALGKMFSYSGQVIVLANGSQFCNSGILNYDSFSPGLQVDGTHLDPFCVKVDDFHASYLSNGQPDSYESNIEYQSGADLTSNTWRPYHLEVNSPLRTAGDRVYLLGHGYAPQFTVTYPDGQVRTSLVQWKPDDMTSYLSEGANKLDPPQVSDPSQITKNQLAITGLFAPNAVWDGPLLESSYPAADNPAVSLDIYKGDLGEDNGISQNIFTIDNSMVASGKLKLVQKANLGLTGNAGGLPSTTTLPDGTKISFDRVVQWDSLQVSHDPTQLYVLVFAVLMLLGLITSLVVKRRRLWVRVTSTPAGEDGTPGRTVVEIGGLARTDQAGYGEEFTRLSVRLRSAASAGAPTGEVPEGRDS